MPVSSSPWVRVAFALLAVSLPSAQSCAADPAAEAWSLDGLRIGDSRADVVRLLAARRLPLDCEVLPADRQRCVPRIVAHVRYPHITVEGAHFADWRFAFAEGRLRSISASVPVGSNVGPYLLSVLTKKFGRPEIRETSFADHKASEARWRVAERVSLTLRQWDDATPGNPRPTLVYADDHAD